MGSEMCIRDRYYYARVNRTASDIDKSGSSIYYVEAEDDPDEAALGLAWTAIVLSVLATFGLCFGCWFVIWLIPARFW